MVVPVNPVDAVQVAVMAYLGAAGYKLAMAPVDAMADHIKGRVGERLAQTRHAADAKADGRPLDVADRVAFKALTEAAFTDDELIADYLGGVLAASTSDDDSGAAVVAQIARLSAHQLRLHYVIYRELRRLWPPLAEPPNLYQESEANRAGLRIPAQDVIDAIGVQGLKRIGSTVPSLVREKLLHERYDFGVDGDHGFTLRVRPSALGAELFLWGSGSTETHASRLWSPKADIRFLTEVSETPNVSLMSAPPPRAERDASNSNEEAQPAA